MENQKPVHLSQHFLKWLGNDISFLDADSSFSPFYSDIGLGFGSGGGIKQLFFHYNRKTIPLPKPFLILPAPSENHVYSPVSVLQKFSGAEVTIAFCDHNTWLIECTGLKELSFDFFLSDTKPEERFQNRAEMIDQRTILFRTFLPTGDPRDADRHFPIVIGLRVISGSFDSKPQFAKPLKVVENSTGKIGLAFCAKALEVDSEIVLERLQNCATSAVDAVNRTYRWFEQALGPAQANPKNKKEAQVIARAAYSLLSNAARAPGILDGYVSAFPSRGRYPTHYLWDSCFQNLALEKFSQQLAPDSLLLLTKNTRQDGKIPHFVCSTWIRPHETQPPLVGWAALRLIRQLPLGETRSKIANEILPVLEANNKWWLSQRMTRFGLVWAYNGFEVGWDNSPRFDNGPAIACDINSYLLLQIKACESLAHLIGDQDKAHAYHNQAKAYGQAMVELLFDSKSLLFWDRDATTGDVIKIKTPACFLPYLADVPVENKSKINCLKDNLLNPDSFFGEIPFPCVAYNDPHYQPEKWWRGPTWLPIAYLMVELLNKSGFEEHATQAANRLYKVILHDENLRELFNSQTGEGMGAYQQGWTAAIFLRLHWELNDIVGS